MWRDMRRGRMEESHLLKFTPYVCPSHESSPFRRYDEADLVGSQPEDARLHAPGQSGHHSWKRGRDRGKGSPNRTMKTMTILYYGTLNDC